MKKEEKEMNALVPVYCQEKCPIGKHCCFGEVYVESIGNKPIRERHKCNCRKKTGFEYVDTVTEKPAA